MWRLLPVMTILLVSGAARDGAAATSRYRYEEANASINGGDGYKTADNTQATLAWGESYILMSYMAMWRGTGDRMYLDRLADHADHVLLGRDDLAGVTEYNGLSSPCWRNAKYQPANELYCYVVHSGMLTWPMIDFAAVVYDAPALWDLPTWDGTTYKDKADLYVQRVEETVAFHAFQWSDGPGAGEGHYVFDPGATFLAYAGQEMPLNQQNALGRTLVTLHLVTGNPAYLDKASRLATRFKNQLTLQGGAYLWNYWGGTYAAPGEDISHAAINVDFARLCAESGIVFDGVDLVRFGGTFFTKVYKDSATLADNVGGTGSVNGSSYKPQTGRWLNLSPYDPPVYAIVRNVYDGYATATGSGSVVLGFALLARHEPQALPYFFYYVDWAQVGDVMTATANNANILAAPPDPDARYIVPITYSSAVPVTGQQWDDEAYHTVARWAATGGAWETRWLAYLPEWWHPYWSDGALFQFTEAPFAGIQVKTSPAPVMPEILTADLPDAWVGGAYDVTLEAAGDGPFEWTLLGGPGGLALSWDGGVLSWAAVPDLPGVWTVEVRLSSDWGSDTVSLTLTVQSDEIVEPNPDAVEWEPDVVEWEPDVVEWESEVVEGGQETWESDTVVTETLGSETWDLGGAEESGADSVAWDAPPDAVAPDGPPLDTGAPPSDVAPDAPEGASSGGRGGCGMGSDAASPSWVMVVLLLFLVRRTRAPAER